MPPLFSDLTVLIRGGGEMATACAHRLFVCGFRVGILELPAPMAVRRAVALAEAVYDGEVCVEGVRGIRCDAARLPELLAAGAAVPVVVDPAGDVLAEVKPVVVVDARMAKENLGTRVTDARLVLGLGPGFVAGVDVHAVVETERGHDLGRVIWRGAARPDSAVPYPLDGVTTSRVLRAPRAGSLKTRRDIGDVVSAGEIVAEVDGAAVSAPIGGLLRGIIRHGVEVEARTKVGDIDPRGKEVDHRLISDKARAIAGGVLEAILSGLRS
jgi:xanthine dehydrogenase accessory factor